MNEVERYYDFFQTIYKFCLILSPAYSLVVWVKPFLKEKTKAWRVGVVYAALGIFLEWIPVPVNMMFFYGGLVFAAFLAMVQIDREYIAQKAFLAVSFFCVRWQAWGIAGSVGNEISGFFIRAFWHDRDEMFLFRTYMFQTVIEGITGCLLMYAAVRCLLWAYGRRREHMEIKEMILLLIPSVFGVAAYGMLRYYNYIYERDSGKSIWNLYESYDLIRMLYIALCFATILVAAYVYRQWKNEQEEDKKREVFARQIQDLESHIAEVEGLYRDMRSLRHDMGNHLMVLEGLYESGAYEEAGTYMESLKKEVQKISPDIVSGSPVTDAVLSGQKKRMEEKGIAFTCDFHYPQNGEIDAFDISIILQNALSNAIEAIERERAASRKGGGWGEYGGHRSADCENEAHISVVSYVVKNMYMIEVANSYTGELTIDEQSGLPMTTKTGDGHGFGLENIRRAARKYYGDAEIGKEVYKGEECCVLRVMLEQSPSEKRT